MKTKNWMWVFVAGAALSGCGEKDGAATSAAGGLPAACEAYLKRATACYDKAGAASAQMRQSLDQVREGWKAVPDQGQLEAACKAADAQFSQTVTALGCE
jgi:hypothetical protein